MRTLNSFSTIQEESQSLAPRSSIKVQREILQFNDGDATTHGAQSLTIPQTYKRHYLDSSSVAYVTFKGSNGYLYYRQIDDVLNPAEYQLDLGDIQLTNSQWTQRGDIIPDFSGTNAFFGTYTGSAVQIRRRDTSGTYADFGPTIPRVMSNTSLLVRRIEAVRGYRTTFSACIVAISTFDYSTYQFTIEFFYVDSSSMYQLDNIIQGNITDSYVNGFDDNTWASYISVSTIPDGIGVYANALPSGRGVMFTIKNGIESPLIPLFPIDIEQSDTSFVPYDISKINAVYYLTGRYTKINTDKSTIGFDMYLTSKDGINWSIGERSSYLCSSKINGKMMLSPNIKNILYAGNDYLFNASATPLQSSASDLSIDLSSDLISWSLTQQVNSSDSASFEVAKNALWTDISSFLSKKGLVAYLKSYQAGDTNVPNFAVIGLDSLEQTRELIGEKNYPLTGRDLAGKKLADWKSSFDIFLNSVSDIETNFSAEDIIDSKTPIRDIKTDEEEIKKKEEKEVEFLKDIGLRYRGLNSPYVGFFDKTCGDGIMEMRAKFSVEDMFNKSAAYAGFIFSASEDADENITGNMVLFPKKGTWASAPTRPVLARFDLDPIDKEDPTKVNTGLKNLEFRTNPLLIGSGDAATPRAVILDSSIDYRGRVAYDAGTPLKTMCEIDGDQFLMVRIFGRKVQYFMKHNAQGSESESDYAFYRFLGEGLFDHRYQMRAPKKNLGGVVLATDSYTSKENFKQAQYGDIASSITAVSPFAVIDAYGFKVGTAHFGYTPGGGGAGNLTTVALNGNAALLPGGTIPVGWTIRVRGIGGSDVDALFRVSSRASSAVNANMGLDLLNGTSLASHDSEIFLLTPTAAEAFGWASSKTERKTTLYDGVTVVDPKAIKRNTLIWGRGIVISEDNSAASDRYIRSDGVFHDILNWGTSGGAWDYLTNPTGEDTTPAQVGWTGSSPGEWRVLLNHGMFYEGTAASKNLPSVPFYFIVDDEIIRAREESFVESTWTTTFTGLFVPVFYRPVKAVARNSSILTGWRLSPTSSPGHEFAGTSTAMKESMIASGGSIAGMLVEVMARNRDDDEEKEKQYYALDATWDGTDDRLVLDKAYEGRLADLEGIAIVSGRGQFQTTKTKHEPDAAVCYAPVNQYGEFPSILIPKTNYYTGNYFSTEDALARTCALAGLRDVKFRTWFTGGAEWAGTITNTPSTLPLIASLKNFDMKAEVYIPGNSGATTPAYKFIVTFRGNYRLIIQQWNDADTIAAGHYGNILVGLATTDSSVAVAGVSSPARVYGAERWLRGVVIPVKSTPISGVITGTPESWSYSNDQSGRFNLRISLNENTLHVELEGQHLYTFALDDYAVYHEGAGAITIGYDNAAISADGRVHIGELGDPVQDYAIKQNNTARSTVDEIIKDRGIMSRSTQDGGILFSQFVTRDDAGSLTANLVKDSYTASDAKLVGHILMTGKVNANYFDPQLLQSEGYKFDSLNNSLVVNTQHAYREAKLAVRLAKELALQRAVSGYAKSLIQPEDKVTLVYTGFSPADYIISAVTYNATKSAVKSDYTLRKFIE